MFYGKLLIMKTFKFKDINEFLGTRQLGAIAREKLLSVMNVLMNEFHWISRELRSYLTPLLTNALQSFYTKCHLKN